MELRLWWLNLASFPFFLALLIFFVIKSICLVLFFFLWYLPSLQLSTSRVERQNLQNDQFNKTPNKIVPNSCKELVNVSGFTELSSLATGKLKLGCNLALFNQKWSHKRVQFATIKSVFRWQKGWIYISNALGTKMHFAAMFSSGFLHLFVFIACPCFRNPYSSSFLLPLQAINIVQIAKKTQKRISREIKLERKK